MHQLTFSISGYPKSLVKCKMKVFSRRSKKRIELKQAQVCTRSFAHQVQGRENSRYSCQLNMRGQTGAAAPSRLEEVVSSNQEHARRIAPSVPVLFLIVQFFSIPATSRRWKCLLRYVFLFSTYLIPYITLLGGVSEFRILTTSFRARLSRIQCLIT